MKEIIEIFLGVFTLILSIYALVQVNRSLELSNNTIRLESMPNIIVENINDIYEDIDDINLLDLNNIFKNNSSIYLENIGKSSAYNVNLKLKVLSGQFIDNDSLMHYQNGEFESVFVELKDKQDNIILEINSGFLNPNKKLDLLNSRFNDFLKINIKELNKELEGTKSPLVKRDYKCKLSCSWDDYYGKKFTINSQTTINLIAMRSGSKDKNNEQPNYKNKIYISIDVSNSEVHNPYF